MFLRCVLLCLLGLPAARPVRAQFSVERLWELDRPGRFNLHGALGGKGVPARIVLFPDEAHRIRRPQAAGPGWHELPAGLDRWPGEGAAAETGR